MKMFCQVFYRKPLLACTQYLYTSLKVEDKLEHQLTNALVAELAQIAKDSNLKKSPKSIETPVVEAKERLK